MRKVEKHMELSEIKSVLKILTADIDEIADKKIATIQKTLLNLVEVLVAENEMLRQQVQALKDEINRLKGEQGKPRFRKQKNDHDNHSSENERKNLKSKPPRKKKNKKKGNIRIDRQVICEIDKKALPDDATFKGHDTVVLQDIKIVTDNVEFKREVFYSPSLKRTFTAKLPEGYLGEFGPGIRALIISLYHDSGMTEPALERFFKTVGLQISKATISRMLTDNHETFHQEKDDIVNAGIKATPYQHLDDTGARVNGKNYYTHILCNPFYTAYFTTPKKDRFTLLKLLSQGELKFWLNKEAYQLMAELGVSDKQVSKLKGIADCEIMARADIDKLLHQIFPNPKKQQSNRNRMLEACAIVYYRRSEGAIEHLICDDAPQFNKITRYKALCWVHEGRHYKKLNPIIPFNRKILDDFIKQFWNFYKSLLDYKKTPSTTMAQQLTKEFDGLFSTKTGYEALDERIAKTLEKKKPLLLVLQFPWLPLNNNSAELGARVQARKRDIHLQTKNEKGTQGKDSFTTIVQTARKLGVNIHDYLYDRISNKFHLQSLAELILQQAGLVIDST